MHPLLIPALRRVWRDGTTLQIGLDPERRLILTGLDAVTRRFIESLDGTGDVARVIDRARADGLDENDARQVLSLLGDAVHDAAAGARPLRTLTSDERARLGPDLSALSLAAPERDGGVAALARRRAATVPIVGVGRIGASVTTLLTAAGVGSVLPQDDELVRPDDLSPAGHAADSVGRPRAGAISAAVCEAFPSVLTRPRRRRQPDIAVLVGSGPQLFERADQLLHYGVAHVFVSVRETTGIVGPLVVPGRTSCHRCVELTRGERDPLWPRVAAQLSVERPADAACDVTLATLVAAQAAGQVLALLDGAHLTGTRHRGLPAAANGTLETSSINGVTRRRSWPPHPACGCSWTSPEPISEGRARMEE